MRTIQATGDLTMELYPPPADEPLLVLRSKAGEVDEECLEGIVVYASEIRCLIDALAEAAVELAELQWGHPDRRWCNPAYCGSGWPDLVQ